MLVISASRPHRERPAAVSIAIKSRVRVQPFHSHDALPFRWQNINTSSYHVFIYSQRHGAGLQVEGLGVPQLHVQAI